jgi:hypothetical protein
MLCSYDREIKFSVAGLLSELCIVLQQLNLLILLHQTVKLFCTAVTWFNWSIEATLKRESGGGVMPICAHALSVAENLEFRIPLGMPHFVILCIFLICVLNFIGDDVMDCLNTYSNCENIL